MSAEANGRNVMVQGRVVWVSGDMFKGRQKIDQFTKVAKTDKNGQPAMEYGFGLAVPKSSLNNDPNQIWQACHEEMFTLYPAARASGQAPPGFAMKFKDGDSIDPEGKPYALRAGYAGCLVFACTTSLPVKFFKNENGQVVMSDDPTLFYPGCYLQVQLQIKAHPPIGQGKAGLYLNPNAALWLGHGERIINAPSGEQIFGNTQPALPPGASATPLAAPGLLVAPPAGGTPMGYQQPAAPAMTPPPAFQGSGWTSAPPQGGQPAFDPSMGQPSVAAPPAVQTQMVPQGVTPHYGVLPQAHQPAYAPQAQAHTMPPVQPAPYGAPPAQQQVPAGVPGMPPFPGQR